RSRADRRADRIPLVQRVPGRGLHGRHRLDGDRRRTGGLRDHDEDDLPAAPDRRHLRDRGALRHPAGLLVPLLGPADIPDDADPPPLRDESLVRDEDHGPLLDRHGPALRGRLRAVLPLLPRVPLNELAERVLVLGLARSGLAAAAALERRGVEVVRADRELGNDEDVGLVEGVGLLVKSPGVPAEAPLVAGARERAVPVWSEIELGSRLLPNPILGVTGTNGKTTTAEWLGFMLGAPVAGNVGRALSELDGEVEPERLVVVELSSFQLEDIHRFRPRIAMLLNLEPDHLDRHGSFEAYRDAKLRIFERARTKIVPRGLGLDGIEFAADDPLPAEPLIRGAHNRENAAAATAAARAAGIGDEQIAHSLRTFPGVPHRLELVRELNGVSYVNDSKATNVAAALRALAAYEDE